MEIIIKCTTDEAKEMEWGDLKEKVEIKDKEDEMTIGGRTYEILEFLKEGEKSVHGNVMVTRAKEMSAHLGEEECV